MGVRLVKHQLQRLAFARIAGPSLAAQSCVGTVKPDHQPASHVCKHARRHLVAPIPYSSHLLIPIEEMEGRVELSTEKCLWGGWWFKMGRTPDESFF